MKTTSGVNQCKYFYAPQWKICIVDIRMLCTKSKQMLPFKKTTFLEFYLLDFSCFAGSLNEPSKF